MESGNYACGYHYREANKEVFYIISGTGILRKAEGEKSIIAGDAIGFLAGKEGAK